MVAISSDRLRAAIRVSYLKSQKINTKVFFREYDSELDFAPLKDETLKESIDANFIYLDMEVKKFSKQFSKLISSGNYDFSDDLPTGYLLAVRLQHPDKGLMSEIIKTLRANRFGCLSGNYTASCNLPDPNPTDERAEQILGELAEAISIDLQSLSKTEVMNMQQYVEVHKVAKPQVIAPTTSSSSSPEPIRSIERKKKRAGIAIAISIISPFFAYGYLGKWKRGFGASGILYGIGIILRFLDYIPDETFEYLVILFTSLASMVVFYIWMIRDLRKLTRLYNTTGFKKPIRYRSHRKRNGIIIGCVLGAFALGYVFIGYQDMFRDKDLLEKTAGELSKQVVNFEQSVVRKQLFNSTKLAIETHALINKERVNHGLSELILYTYASSVAQERADCMAGIGDQKCAFMHSSDVTLHRACRDSFVVGENIFMSSAYADASVAVDGWMGSSGHRANILSDVWQSEGIGVSSSIYGTYFVQIFCGR